MVRLYTWMVGAVIFANLGMWRGVREGSTRGQTTTGATATRKNNQEQLLKAIKNDVASIEQKQRFKHEILHDGEFRTLVCQLRILYAFLPFRTAKNWADCLAQQMGHLGDQSALVNRCVIQLQDYGIVPDCISAEIAIQHGLPAATRADQAGTPQANPAYSRTARDAAAGLIDDIANGIATTQQRRTFNEKYLSEQSFQRQIDLLREVYQIEFAPLKLARLMDAIADAFNWARQLFLGISDEMNARAGIALPRATPPSRRGEPQADALRQTGAASTSVRPERPHRTRSLHAKASKDGPR